MTGSQNNHAKETGLAEKAGARSSNLLVRAPSLLAGATLFALMLMTFSDVIMRSVFNEPIEAATELTRLFMGIIVFASLPVVTWHNKHIAVDLFDGFFARGARRIRDVAIDLLSGAALTWPAYRVWQLALRARESNEVTEYLNIPQFYIAAFIAFAALVTAAILLLRAILGVFAPNRLPGNDKTPHYVD